PSEQSTVGIEWELAIVDLASGELTPAAPTVLQACGGGEDAPIRKEYLQDMVEIVSGVHRTVAAAVEDVAHHLREVQRVAAPLGLGVVGAGTHPFSPASAQPRFEGPRYDVVAERTGYWGRRMAICGTHVHVGIDHRDKALPVTTGLARFYPYLLAITCSSPFWEGEDTGYASQRTMLFQQLPTNGLPYPMSRWTEFEAYAEDRARVPHLLPRPDLRVAPAVAGAREQVAGGPLRARRPRDHAQPVAPRGAAARGAGPVAGTAHAGRPRPRLRGRAALRRGAVRARGELRAAAGGGRAAGGAAPAAGRNRTPHAVSPLTSLP
ncbi:MAG: YbdK family carboxylate-amine ligase, partial [Actinobacteria bacterium]|nr:YbdK family carboxylate-amine ligase [Actinomycetota bacterium]